MIEDQNSDAFIVLVIRDDESFPVILHKGKYYSFEKLQERYNKKCHEASKKEILQHVWMEMFEDSKKDIPKNALSRIFKSKKEKIICKLYVKRDSNIPIEIFKYPRPFFKTNSEGSVSFLVDASECNSVWKSQRQDFIQKANLDFIKEYKIKDKYLGTFNSKDIAQYPNSLGKGMNCCVQLKNYYRKEEYDPLKSDYESEKTIMEILNETSENPRAVTQCINSEHCGLFYKKLLSKEFNNISQQIEVCEVEGKIYPYGNGNHRLCLLKRLNINKQVKANIIVYEKIKDSQIK